MTWLAGFAEPCVKGSDEEVVTTAESVRESVNESAEEGRRV